MADTSREQGGSRDMGLCAVVAIGIGGMVGGRIFAVLGVAVKPARGGTPVAFLLAGLVALVTSYSYARLSVTFPSEGGTVEFVTQGLGVGRSPAPPTPCCGSATSSWSPSTPSPSAATARACCRIPGRGWAATC